MVSDQKPTLYIIAGCNGAGKTTASMTVLPVRKFCQRILLSLEEAIQLKPHISRQAGVRCI